MISEMDVRCFLDLSKTLSFTVTAENLYVTQQAISKRIDGLEKDLGLTLFIRSYHEVTLTEDGLALAELFERFNKEFDETINQRRKAENFKKNIMTVGYQAWSYYGSVPHFAHMEMEKYFPDFILQGQMLAPHKLMDLLDANAIDIVMLFERLAGSLIGYRSLKVKEEDIMLLVSNTQVAASGDARLESFASEPLLIDVHEIRNMQEVFVLAGMQAYGISPTELLIRPNQDSVYLSVELGQGVALGTSICQTEDLSITKIPTGKKDNLICVWRDDIKDPRIEVYANLIYKLYQQRIEF